jgi:VanZ family protein
MVVVVPWRSLQSHPHWARIRWVPFVSPPVRAVDILGNILLYVPFGYFACLHSRRHAWLWGVAGAALLSGTTEVTQIFSHGRFPSLQDVLMNVLGAVLGVLWGGFISGDDRTSSQ